MIAAVFFKWYSETGVYVSARLAHTQRLSCLYIPHLPHTIPPSSSLVFSKWASTHPRGWHYALFTFVLPPTFLSSESISYSLAYRPRIAMASPPLLNRDLIYCASHPSRTPSPPAVDTEAIFNLSLIRPTPVTCVSRSWSGHVSASSKLIRPTLAHVLYTPKRRPLILSDLCISNFYWGWVSCFVFGGDHKG